MQFAKVKTTEYTDATNGGFVSFFSEVVQALVNNSIVFPNLPFTTQELQERVTAITQKTNSAENGSRDQKNARDLERSVCTTILFKLAEYVMKRAWEEDTYEAQVAIIEMAKFSAYKPAEPAGLIPSPTPKAQISNSAGTIVLDWKGHRNVKCWILQHVAGTDVSPNANWQYFATVTKSKYMATGLPSGYHSFRLITVSAAGESSPSEAVTEYAR